jgi:hypothetical protein
MEKDLANLTAKEEAAKVSFEETVVVKYKVIQANSEAIEAKTARHREAGLKIGAGSSTSSSSSSTPPPARVTLVPVHASVAEGSQPKRRRAETSSLEPGPAAFALRPYAGHSAVFVGRSLWCLKCFEVPSRHFQAWRHGRRGGCRRPLRCLPA